jgi:hypothetical protein
MNPYNPQVYRYAVRDGLDGKIEQLRECFAHNVLWLDRAFGRAYNLSEKAGIGYVKVPKVIIGDTKEYMSMMPNDNLGSYCWFIGVGPETPEEWDARNPTKFFTKDVDLIFYFNYKKIDQSKDYPFVESLKEEILYYLNAFNGVVLNSIHTETVDEVYDGYNLEQITRDLFYYPFGGMKFSLSLSYKINCSI